MNIPTGKSWVKVPAGYTSNVFPNVQGGTRLFRYDATTNDWIYDSKSPFSQQWTTNAILNAGEWVVIENSGAPVETNYDVLPYDVEFFPVEVNQYFGVEYWPPGYDPLDGVPQVQLTFPQGETVFDPFPVSGTVVELFPSIEGFTVTNNSAGTTVTYENGAWSGNFSITAGDEITINNPSWGNSVSYALDQAAYEGAGVVSWEDWLTLPTTLATYFSGGNGNGNGAGTGTGTNLLPLVGLGGLVLVAILFSKDR